MNNVAIDMKSAVQPTLYVCHLFKKLSHFTMEVDQNQAVELFTVKQDWQIRKIQGEKQTFENAKLRKIIQNNTGKATGKDKKGFKDKKGGKGKGKDKDKDKKGRNRQGGNQWNGNNGNWNQSYGDWNQSYDGAGDYKGERRSRSRDRNGNTNSAGHARRR